MGDVGEGTQRQKYKASVNKATSSNYLVAQGNQILGVIYIIAIVTPHWLSIANRALASKDHPTTTEVNSTIINHWQNKTHLITYLTWTGVKKSIWLEKGSPWAHAPPQLPSEGG
jgi:hypothetical protein